ncbi:MAG: pitrilysin family protein [Bacteroidetes bacterium]|jgi:zinc protease|nr:pitrilysin family protein [Bacteroidota bacterium]
MKKIFSFRIFLLLPAFILLLSAGTEQKNPFPELERYKLKNGLEVIFADYGNLPVTSISFFINVGKKSETPGQQGLSSLTANALGLGSDKYNRIDLGREIFRTGARLSSSSNENFTLLSGEFLNRDIDKGMDILSSVLLHPVFPQQDIDEQRGYEISQNKPSKMDIGDLADEYGNYFAYGIAHPLGRHYYAAQYLKLTNTQIKEFYNFNYTPGNTKLVVSGKTDHAQMKLLIEKYFGAWTAAYGEVNGASYEIPAIKTKEYAFVQKDSSKQACLQWYKKAPAAGSKDVAAFMLANDVFSDHLGKEIREKDGFTYGIYSTFRESQNDEMYRSKTQIRNEVMFATMAAFDKVLNDFYTNGATEVELKKFKTMLKVSINNREEPADVAALINPWVYRDYSKRQQILAEIDAVDIPALNKAIKKYFTPDCYKLIIAGDASLLNDQLTKIPKLQKLEWSVIEKDQ